MRRLLVPSLVLVSLGLACFPACAKKHRFEKSMAGTELSTIRIEMVGNECRVVDLEFAKVRSAKGRRVEWIIAGQCSNVHEISVGRFTLNDAPMDPIVIKKTADPETGSRIIAIVRDPVTAGTYRYEALFDGVPAKVKGAAGRSDLDDAGDFEVCPDWPCS